MHNNHDPHATKTKEAQVTRCSFCGEPGVEVRPIEKYHYKQSGLPNVWLHGGGVLEYKCPSCRNRSIAVQRESQLLQVIAVWLLTRPGRLRAEELRYLRKASGLTQEELGEKLDVQRGAVVNWESGQIDRIDFKTMVALRLVLLGAFQRALNEEGNNHLSEEQRQRLDEFAKGFVREYEGLVRRARRATATIENRDDSWELPEAA